MDATLYRIVKVHTAKCTECDKRNKAVMRRCPGCTFQVCTPCFERRKKNGKGLRHGMSMSSSASPLTVRAAQRKIDVGGGGEVPRMEELKKKEVGSEGDKGGVVGESGKAGESVGGGETVSVGVQKEKVKVVVTPKPKPKRRAIKKQKKTAKFVESEDDLSSELSDPEDYASPTPSKRRRSTLTVDSAPTVVGPPQSEGKKRFVPLSTSRSSAPTTSSAAAPSSSTLESALPAPDKTAKTMEPSRTPVSKLGINELMHVYGVNTAENPYHEHLLSRREPVVSNPNIRIPDRIARGFKPRRTAEDIHKDIQEKVRKKLEEGVWGKPANAQEASTSYYHDHCTNAPTSDNPLTVRMFVETEAAKYRDDIAMDEDENKALVGLLEAEALSWGTKTFRGLHPQVQSLMRPGLNVRLDLLSDPEAATSQLAQILKEKAAAELTRMEGDRA